MRIIYLGTPAFAVPTLINLIQWPHCQVVGVVTQPDKPVGRGNKVQAPPVKEVALAHNIHVWQPNKLSRSPEIVQEMKEAAPDLLVMVAFGQILKKSVLEMAPLGVINLHGSLLPAYRGPAPINWAIINGEKKTGATTMFTDAGVDTGDMLLKREIALTEDMTSQELSEIMSRQGADLVIETLEKLRAGTLERQKQDDLLASHAPMLSKEMGQIDWRKPAATIHNLVRGLKPWPGTYTHFKGEVLKVLKTQVLAEGANGAQNMPASASGAGGYPGCVVSSSPKVLIACGELGQELIELQTVQPANKAMMSARDWANGARVNAGVVLGEQTRMPEAHV